MTSKAAPDAKTENGDSPPDSTHGHPHGPTWVLALGALGVVYGDIGTSPLYALRECFVGPHGMPITPQNVIGILSLIFWSLTVVVSVKYLVFVMRADNEGEDGILALLAVAAPPGAPTSRRRTVLVLIGLFGAALLYGEGMITPAISVLSAVEGLQVATTWFKPFVVPIAVGILIGLFAVQRHGTAGLAALFGPTMLVWFSTIAVLGLTSMLNHRGGLWVMVGAINPVHAIQFFLANGVHGFLILGSVVLVVTGSEALYADMGHFGKRPIRLAWYAVVFPALLLNYFGQGALFLEEGTAVTNPFFQLAPDWALYPLVALSTLATVVASQALISGSFSLTQQAVQLGYAPRFNIVHTSGSAVGQIYIPEINTGLMVTCVLLVLGFRSSSNLAGAYGLAVTGTMTVTTVLFLMVSRERWHWSPVTAGLLTALFLLFDLAFFGANLTKILHGGWFPLLVGLIVFTILTTWKSGRAEVAELLSQAGVPLSAFLADLAEHKPYRVPGTAIFMTSTPEGVPPVLLHHFKHNKTLHERVVLLSIVSEKRPEVPDRERIELTNLEQGFFRVVAHFGFMETPQIRHVLRLCVNKGLSFHMMETTFFLGRETLLSSGRGKMGRWRKRLYAFLARNAPTATAFFGIPPNRVVELGTQLEL